MCCACAAGYSTNHCCPHDMLLSLDLWFTRKKATRQAEFGGTHGTVSICNNILHVSRHEACYIAGLTAVGHAVVMAGYSSTLLLAN